MVDMADAISQLWTRLERWGSDNAPAMLQDLNPPATEEQLAELQKAVGRLLPTSFLQSLKFHNGESDGWPSRVFADRGAYLPSERVAEEWQQRQMIADQLGFESDEEELAEMQASGVITVDGPVTPVTFSKDWIPIMDCNGDIFWALDFAPAEGGKPGQVIQVDWEGTYHGVVADSFEAFLAAYVADLEAGRYRIEQGLPTQEPPDND